jgi:hypothetical protein
MRIGSGCTFPLFAPHTAHATHSDHISRRHKYFHHPLITETRGGEARSSRSRRISPEAYFISPSPLFPPRLRHLPPPIARGPGVLGASDAVVKVRQILPNHAWFRR